jgi:putative intracellular protease/amidase
MAMGGSADRDFVAELRRWEDSGADWQVVARTQRGVTIALMRCDGGEEADRFTTNDPRVLEFVRSRED